MTGNPNTKYKTWAEIDLGALRHNYRTVAAAVHARAPRCRVIGVVHRRDDNEDKLIAAPAGVTFTKEQMENAVRFQEQWFKTEIVGLPL